jgi:predicted nuclease with TOPRIM domain
MDDRDFADMENEEAWREVSDATYITELEAKLELANQTIKRLKAENIKLWEALTEDESEYYD